MDVFTWILLSLGGICFPLMLFLLWLGPRNRHPELRSIAPASGTLSPGGQTNWPPMWTPIHGPKTAKPVAGEVGLLEDVYRISPTRAFLRMQHEQTTYLGMLEFDNRKLCYRVCELLRQHCGETIAKIAELDI
jgi:hypothetical protein